MTRSIQGNHDFGCYGDNAVNISLYVSHLSLIWHLINNLNCLNIWSEIEISALMNINLKLSPFLLCYKMWQFLGFLCEISFSCSNEMIQDLIDLVWSQFVNICKNWSEIPIKWADNYKIILRCFNVSVTQYFF